MGRGIKRLGLLGGTFDPPHFGHLWLAETARAQLPLDEVLFLPVGDPVHKQDKSITAVTHRIAMTQLAIQENPYFSLDATDIERPSPHTTISLIPLIQEKYADAQLWLLIGGDSLDDLPTWTQPNQLIQLCRLAVLPRPDTTIHWETLTQTIPNIQDRVDILEGPPNALSSTTIRHWVQQGNSIRYLTETAVSDYITKHNLYQK